MNKKAAVAALLSAGLVIGVPSVASAASPADDKVKPFCSTRCRQVDLNRWLSESYRIPGAERSNDGEDGKNQSESED
jgi:hypothetical protein